MRHTRKLHLVWNTDNSPEPVSAASADEETRYLELADIALNNLKPDADVGPAGSRTKENHKRLEQELQDAVEKVEQDRDKAA